MYLYMYINKNPPVDMSLMIPTVCAVVHKFSFFSVSYIEVDILQKKIALSLVPPTLKVDRTATIWVYLEYPEIHTNPMSSV